MAFIAQCVLVVVGVTFLALASPFLAGAFLCLAGVLLIEDRA